MAISPEKAFEAGARWRVDGGSWQNSGVTLSGIASGKHAVEFKEIPGWSKPAGQSVDILGNQTANVRGAYVQQTGSLNVILLPQGAVTAGAMNETTSASGVYVQQAGSLMVTISPREAIDAGALWRVDDGAWNNSGAIVSGLAVGPHSVELKDAPGWIRPADKTVDIENGKTTSTNALYTPVVIEYTLAVQKIGTGSGTVKS